MATGPTALRLLKGATLALALSLGACAYGPYNTHARVGVHGHYDSAYDDYYFYPDVNVYLGVNSGRYYYRPHDRWVGTWTRPGVVLRHDHRVKLKRLPRGRPFEHYHDHHKRYRRR